MGRWLAVILSLLTVCAHTLSAGSASPRPKDEPIPAHLSGSERIEYLDEQISKWEIERKKQERRARYNEREARRLQFFDVGYARRYFQRADYHREQAAKAAAKVESLKEERSELLHSPRGEH